MKTNKSWAVNETAIVYQLLVLGYSHKEIIELCGINEPGNLLIERTPDSIGAKCSEVKKYISQQKGITVKNYDISGTVERHILKASQIVPNEFVTKFLPMPSAANNIVKPPFTREGVTSSPLIPTVDIITDQDPVTNIIDVMRMAKELGAAEVEYSGVKIKF